MSVAFWSGVIRDGMAVPTTHSLSAMTDDLVDLLSSPDPDHRDGIAYPVLASWIEDGVYDERLERLGDSLCGLLEEGLGERDTDSVFLRSYSSLLIGEAIARDTAYPLLDGPVVRRWGDRLTRWYLAEQDLRGWVDEKGWAGAIAHGADSIGRLGDSRHLHRSHLVFLLDTLAERLITTEPFLVAGEPDRLALATFQVLRRDEVTMDDLEPWLKRLTDHGHAQPSNAQHPFLIAGNVQNYLRALALQLALVPRAPAIRHDLLKPLYDSLRTTNPEYLPAR